MNQVTCASCGQPATTGVQTGYDPSANYGTGGGIFTPLCEECYGESVEAAHHRKMYAEVVQDVQSGLYTRTVLHGHVRWVGPGGRFHSDVEHHRLSTDPYAIHGR